MPMKPLQFSQDKKELSFLTCKATYSTTRIFSSLQKIRQVHPVTWKNINRTNQRIKTAKLLAEYYLILFSTATLWKWIRKATPHGQALSNLEWLFPTAEPIHINSDTNFILLPIYLPTYFQYTHERLYGRVPFLTPYQPNTPTTEWIRNIDFQEDNLYICWARHVDQSNINKWYQHMNFVFKNQLIQSPQDISSYLRVYKYTDISPYDAKVLPNPSSYSLADIPPYSIQHNYLERQFTFLEITSYDHRKDTFTSGNVHNPNKIVRLKTHSEHLEPLILSTSHFIDIAQHPYMFDDVVEYFKKHNDCNQYSVPELKSGLRQLKKAIA